MSVLALAILWLPTSPVAGQGTAEAAAQAPVIEESTLMVLHLDLTKIDVAAMTEWLQRIDKIKVGPESVDQIAKLANDYIRSVRATGTDELFVTLSTFDLMKATPVVIAKTDNPVALESLLSVLWKLLPDRPSKLGRMGDYVVFGSTKSVDRIVSNDNESSIRFQKLLLSPQLEHQWILSLPDESKADLVAMWPDVAPKASPLEFSPRGLAADLTSIRLAWSLPPKIDAKIEFKAVDDAATKRVSEFVNRLIELIPADWTAKLDVAANGQVVSVTADSETLAQAATAALNEQFRMATEMQTSNNLKQVALSIHNYHSVYKKIPEPIVDENGDPLLSWRVTILPFMQQQALFEQIARDKAWSASENEPYSQTAVPQYLTNESQTAETTIRIPIIKGSLWSEPGTAKTFRSITDGSSNTIMAAAAPADQKVPWMKPGYWQLDEDDLLGSFFGDRDSMLVVAYDGAVYKLRRDEMTEKQLRGLLTHAGREPAEWP